jgi:RimJ/RimL family protein N-acetyltransferase
MKPGTIFEKQYFRRSIEGYRSPYDDPFEYRTVPDVGEESVIAMMVPFIDDTSNPDQLAQSRIEWNSMTWDDGAKYRPEHWLVAYKDGIPIGVVFPTRYVDMPSGGSLSTIGIFPEHQGKGYSKILHAKGLESLAAIGVTEYVGSTEITNKRMIATALHNGCMMTKIYKIKVDELGRHRPIDSYPAT